MDEGSVASDCVEGSNTAAVVPRMVDEVKNPPGLEGEVMVVVVVVVVGLLAMLAHRGLDFVRVRKD